MCHWSTAWSLFLFVTFYHSLMTEKCLCVCTTFVSTREVVKSSQMAHLFFYVIKKIIYTIAVFSYGICACADILGMQGSRCWMLACSRASLCFRKCESFPCKENILSVPLEATNSRCSCICSNLEANGIAILPSGVFEGLTSLQEMWVMMIFVVFNITHWNSWHPVQDNSGQDILLGEGAFWIFKLYLSGWKCGWSSKGRIGCCCLSHCHCHR